MSEQIDLSSTISILNHRFILDHPQYAAKCIEEMPIEDAAEILSAYEAPALVPVVSRLTTAIAAKLESCFSVEFAAEVLTELAPNDSVRILSVMDDTQKQLYLDKMDDSIVEELERLQEYPLESAGRLMETRVQSHRGSATVESTLDKLRKEPTQSSRSLFIIDDDNRLSGRVTIQDIAIAPIGKMLSELSMPVSAVVNPVSPRAEVVELFGHNDIIDLPVVDVDGHLLGIIYNDALVQAVQQDASAGIQTMVGASKDERALSTAMFAVRKRMPWLQINLLTAFLAASVVGLFEETIAQFTALAVLLPVVAGQSGNAGAQALAVTMRGLALREISLRHWFQVTFKEVRVGFVNGIAIAITCGIGVYFWSDSLGLVLVIAVSMVIAMIAAGFAGAIVPILLTRLGQDPAQSSSIILTTVTDVAGFFSFLGIATLMASTL
jgi:magnesium transporter